MKQELEQKLFKKYPKIFAEADLSPQESCMHWGICVGDGWYTLLDCLFGSIQHHIDGRAKLHDDDNEFNRAIESALAGDRTQLEDRIGDWVLDREERINEILEEGLRDVTPLVPQLIATQIKEKFGTLRFHYRGGDARIRGMVSLAYDLSHSTCEVCGAPGRIREGGWITVRCDEHVKK